MADEKTIGELDPYVTTPSDDDFIPVELADGSATKKITVADLATAPVFAAAGGVSSVNGETGAVVIDAGDVDIVDSGTLYTATEVEGALAEVMTAHNAHVADTSDAHDASAISFSPASGIAATDVQAAIVEDAGDLAAHLADTSDAHDASAVSFSAAGGIAATDVQAAIEELDTEKALKTQAQNAQTGTTYTLVLTDADKLVTLSNASAITMTVPPNSSVAFPIGTRVDLAQLGAGQVTVAQGAGVTINKPSTQGLKLVGQYSEATLTKYATDTWLLAGHITA